MRKRFLFGVGNFTRSSGAPRPPTQTSPGPVIRDMIPGRGTVSAILRDASDPSISARGRRMAHREEWNNTNLYLLTAKDVGDDGPAGFGEPVSVVSASREDISPAFSPVGERIARGSRVGLKRRFARVGDGPSQNYRGWTPASTSTC